MADKKRHNNPLRSALEAIRTRLFGRHPRSGSHGVAAPGECAGGVAEAAELEIGRIFFANAGEGIFVTDTSGTILKVNPAFSTITGYSAEEAVGQNPRILKSDHQDAAFYRQMWAQILRDGSWQGELWNRRKSGEAYLQSATISVIRDAAGRPKNYVSIFTDVTELHLKEEHIRHQAYHDALTGLPNRMLFQDRLRQALAHTRRTGEPGAVIFLGLDRFKVVNDTFGHGTGDALLQAVGSRLRARLRQEDTVSRFGGDQFVILAAETANIRATETVASILLDCFDQPFEVGAREISISASLGISVFPEDGEDETTILANADTALSRAKERGHGAHQFYTADMNARALERWTIENGLRKALDNDEFELYYQPRVELFTGRIVGMEALIRWHHPELGLVSPGQFIPVAEETGLIGPIGEWVLREACLQTRRWREEGFELRTSVNLSARQFHHPQLRQRITATLEETGLEGKHLELELTESLIMRDAEEAIETLAELKTLGVSIAIDDFGTGYSSLNYLKRFPLDVLKIDQSFVRDITNDPDDAVIAETIIALGHNLRLEVVAEGVETEDQVLFLERRRCDTVQGFFFSRPVPAGDFERLLKRGAQFRLPERGPEVSHKA